ncbi:hypothetical protein BP6252_04323 [Coleophoma cylindrospora]|uniref:Extracellular mutant protein 11 C-terminal domain-containing protein n=1 Tax=Coleophoma cylindrospora TaxID=1849047 RepID=A0A3D8S067_9HELO|nr:hypothetical protein BP6252_04323 [Coleophoma cylindrospora]
MSGLQGFVHNKSDQDGRASPQRLPGKKLSAESAQALKIQPSTTMRLPLHTPSKHANVQPTASISQRFSPTAFARKTLPQHEFTQPQDVSSEPENERGVFAESVVGSDFEDTNTTINFDPNQDYGNSNGNGNSYAGPYEDTYGDNGKEDFQPQSYHEHLKAPTQRYAIREAQIGSRTAGRFLAPQTALASSNTQSRPNIPVQTLQIPVPGHQISQLRKRDHQGEQIGQSLNEAPDESDEYDDSSNDGSPGNGEAISDQNSPDPGSKGEPTAPAIDYTPDYNHDQLQKMTYSVLALQAFDEVPISQEENKIHVGEGEGIDHKMAKLVELSSQEEKSSAARLCVEGMTADEWEQGGEWFLDQFTNLVARLKDAKREKREIVARFEKEIESRQRAVSGKTVAFQRELEGMQKGAEQLMRGKSK